MQDSCVANFLATSIKFSKCLLDLVCSIPFTLSSRESLRLLRACLRMLTERRVAPKSQQEISPLHVTWPPLEALCIQIPVTTADASPYHPKSVRHSLPIEVLFAGNPLEQR